MGSHEQAKATNVRATLTSGLPRYPVFIVGSARSGTSILVDAMVAAGYRGFREGNFLSLLANLDSAVERHLKIFQNGNPKVLASNVSKDRLKEELFGVLHRITMELNPEPPWFDKTGGSEMISAIPALRKFWPESVFVFAKRRGIENVLSRMQKFPSLTFQQHCIAWANNMSAWRKLRQLLPRDVAIEIDQQSILQRPEAVAQRLVSFLMVQPDKEKRLVRTFEAKRPQQSADGTAARISSLQTTGWSESEISMFLDFCKTEMDAFGYSFDESYSLGFGCVLTDDASVNEI